MTRRQVIINKVQKISNKSKSTYYIYYTYLSSGDGGSDRCLVYSKIKPFCRFECLIKTIKPKLIHWKNK